MGKHVLVTGAAGRIGSDFARFNKDRYTLRLMVRGDEEGIDVLRDCGEVVTADLGNMDALKRITSGIDTVLHLAADPSPSATWSSLLDANIVGTYNIVAAAKANGCRRIVYASSIHAVSGYPADVQVKAYDPVNPGDLYGVSKCFAEALCRYMAEQEELSAVVVRIGAYQPLEAAQSEGSVGMMDAFVSPRDLNQLFVRCIDNEQVRFAIVHGLSNNRFKRLDISSAREVFGYAPEDDLTQEHPILKELNLPDTVSTHNVSDEGQKSGLREEVRS
jgi:nucleoside-diphosphate-sugar epimerase